MSQRVNLGQFGLQIRKKIFVAKTEVTPPASLQRVNLGQFGLQVRKKSFTAKTPDAPVPSVQRVNLGNFGLQIRKKTFVAKTLADGVVDFMRSMRMGINYEGILEDVTPDDDNDLTAGGMLYVGGAGDIKVTGLKSGTVTLVGIPAGTWLNFCRVKRVFSTGTTATNIVLAR